MTGSGAMAGIAPEPVHQVRERWGDTAPGLTCGRSRFDRSMSNANARAPCCVGAHAKVCDLQKRGTSGLLVGVQHATRVQSNVTESSSLSGFRVLRMELNARSCRDSLEADSGADEMGPVALPHHTTREEVNVSKSKTKKKTKAELKKVGKKKDKLKAELKGKKGKGKGKGKKKG